MHSGYEGELKVEKKKEKCLLGEEKKREGRGRKREREGEVDRRLKRERREEVSFSAFDGHGFFWHPLLLLQVSLHCIGLGITILLSFAELIF